MVNPQPAQRIDCKSRNPKTVQDEMGLCRLRENVNLHSELTAAQAKTSAVQVCRFKSRVYMCARTREEYASRNFLDVTSRVKIPDFGV